MFEVHTDSWQQWCCVLPRYILNIGRRCWIIPILSFCSIFIENSVMSHHQTMLTYQQGEGLTNPYKHMRSIMCSVWSSKLNGSIKAVSPFHESLTWPPGTLLLMWFVWLGVVWRKLWNERMRPPEQIVCKESISIMAAEIIDTLYGPETEDKTPKPSCYMSPWHSYYHDCYCKDGNNIDWCLTTNFWYKPQNIESILLRAHLVW